ISFPRFAHPKKSNIWLTDQIDAKGLATPLTAISGADPCTGSNIEGYFFSACQFAPAASPIPPAEAAPTSVKISPNNLEVTTTSKRAGSIIICIAAASTKYEYVVIFG